MPHEDFVALITTSARSKNVKILASSRPLLEFEEGFQGCPKLRLHHFTAPDIKTYVAANFDGHERMRRLGRNQPEKMAKLVSDTTSKSSGIFLWVRLVMEALLATMSRDEHASFEKLNAQLEVLPEDLHDLFSHMLEQIRPEDHDQASRIFSLVSRATSSNEFRFRNGASRALSLSLLDVSLGLEYSVKLGRIDAMTCHEIDSRCKEVERTFRSKCRGLVEVCPRKHTHWSCNSHVQFIHKPVTDFFTSRNASIIHPRHFSPANAILQSQIRVLKSLDFGQDMPPELPWKNENDLISLQVRIFLYDQCPEWASIWEGIVPYTLCWCMKLAETVETSFMVAALDELDRILTVHWKRGRPLETYHWTACTEFLSTEMSRGMPDMHRHHMARQVEINQTFVSFCVQNSVLHRYITAKVTSLGMATLKPGKPILRSSIEYFADTCVFDFSRREYPFDEPDLELLEFLLQNGADPNEPWTKSGKTTSPWSDLVTHFERHSCPHSLPAITSFVNHDALPNVVVYKRDDDWTTRTPCRVIQDYVASSEHERQCKAEILGLLHRRGGKAREWYKGKLVYPHYYGLLSPRSYMAHMRIR